MNIERRNNCYTVLFLTMYIMSIKNNIARLFIKSGCRFVTVPTIRLKIIAILVVGNLRQEKLEY